MSSPFFEEMLSSDDPVKSKYTNETLRLTPPDAYSVYFFFISREGREGRLFETGRQAIVAKF